MKTHSRELTSLDLKRDYVATVIDTGSLLVIALEEVFSVM